MTFAIKLKESNGSFTNLPTLQTLIPSLLSLCNASLTSNTGTTAADSAENIQTNESRIAGNVESMNSTAELELLATLPWIAFLQGKVVAPSKEALKDDEHWIKIQYVNGVTIDGTGGGGIDGNGSTWWPCKSCSRPRYSASCAKNSPITNDYIVFLFLQCVSNLKFTNSPKQHITLSDCNGAKFSNIDIQSPSYSPNTDGFDISTSKNVSIEDSTIQSGDDCIAVKEGSSYISATRIACGLGHGISIGSLGINESYQTVEEVYVHNCSFTNTTNGARIKTFPGGSGYARNITFEQIQLSNVKNPIVINQFYRAKKRAKHYDIKVEKESSVQVTNVTYRGFNGSYIGDLAINLNCTSCFNIVLDQVYILSSQDKKRG
ncbi:polygalacturonase ADPG1 [Medicago truncatula]|uniref:polygalacturonase ADPG1 n=1 Tax=Medicago truncatula TaxID=3880 RepID=UPI000D2F2EFB|nr:polygalacturonase ADPG1 [Medicago truncatula]